MSEEMKDRSALLVPVLVGARRQVASCRLQRRHECVDVQFTL